jgi:hypothetical protein
MRCCVAFTPDASSPNAWRQCRRNARAKSWFCRQHEELIAGALLGFFALQAVLDARQVRKTSLADMPVNSRVPS